LTIELAARLRYSGVAGANDSFATTAVARGGSAWTRVKATTGVLAR
jgi:hypothetical protein